MARAGRYGAALLLLALGLALAILLAPPPVPPVPARAAFELRDVELVNPGMERVRACHLRVRDGRIEEIVSGAACSAAPGAGPPRGGFVLPGLIDMHVHLPSRWIPGDARHHALLYLRHGVTTVRAVGSLDASERGLRRQIRDGDLPGPRIFTCGPFVDGVPPVWPGSVVVENGREAREAVRRIAAEGADCIKAYEHLTAEALAALHDEASRLGLRVVGHIPVFVDLNEAALDDVQHLWGAPRWPRRPNTVLRDLVRAWAALDEARVTEIRETARARDWSVTPTLVLYERRATLRPDRPLPRASLLPAFYADVLWSAELNPGGRVLSPGGWQRFPLALRNMRWTVRALHEDGVPIHLGTDAYAPFVIPGASAQEELGHLAAAGLGPEAAWAAGTRVAGGWLPNADGLGGLHAGAPADLLVLRRDPTRDLSALASLETVVADGRPYPVADLDAALAESLRYFAFAPRALLTRVVLRTLLRLVGPGEVEPDTG